MIYKNLKTRPFVGQFLNLETDRGDVTPVEVVDVVRRANVLEAKCRLRISEKGGPKFLLIGWVISEGER